MDWSKLLGSMGGGMGGGGGGGGGKTTSSASDLTNQTSSSIGVLSKDVVLIAAIFGGALALVGLLWLALKK